MKKGFTLVELLAVIVILAVILVIAVPQINSVIKQTRKNSLGSTAKLIAAKAEEKEVENDALEKTESITCADLVKLDDNYGNCTVSKNSTTGKWEVTIVGTNKFSGYTCTGTKSNVVCQDSGESGSNTDLACNAEYCYLFGSEIQIANGYNSEIKTDWRNVKDSSNNQRPVFLKFKNDLSEKYVCTLYDSAVSNGLGTEPTCFSSEVYNNRAQSNSEWSKMQTLFGSSNCSELSSNVVCDVNAESVYWRCYSNSDGAICNWYGGSLNVICDVPSGDGAWCSG